MPSAAERLHEAERSAAHLQQQLRDVEHSIAALSAEAAQQVEGANGPELGQQPPLPASLADCAAELALLSAGELYLKRLQDLQSVVRQLEKLVAGLQGQQAAQGRHAYLRAASQGLGTFAAVHSRADKLAQVATSGLPSELVHYGEGVMAAGKAAQDVLSSGLEKALYSVLADLKWPPPLVPAAASSDQPNGVSPGATSPGTWAGFQDQEGRTNADLLEAVYCLVGLQRVTQSTSFDQGLKTPGIDTPALDVMTLLAAPITARLRLHFASGRRTDRIDRPEWLFATALRVGEAPEVQLYSVPQRTARKQVAKDLSPSFAALQPALARPGLQACYHLPFEFARAVRGGVQRLLREHLLPRLAAQEHSEPWLHFVDEAVRFERELAPLKGLPAEEDDSTGPHLWAEGSCLEVICERDTWQQPWLAAEEAEARKQLQESLDAESAWEPAQSAWGSQGALGGSDSSRQTPAWQQELWPPVCAEGVLQQAAELCRRAMWLHDADSRAAFTAAVPRAGLRVETQLAALQALVRIFRVSLARLCKGAEDMRDLASPHWAPRVAAYVNSAHFLQQALQESRAVVLLNQQPRPDAFPTDLGLDGLQEEVDSSMEGSQQDSLLGRVTATAESGPSSAAGAHSQESLMEAEARLFGTFWRKWALKVARAVVADFKQDSAAYRRKLSLADFAAGPEVPRQGTVSRRLAPAISHLEQSMQLLSSHLDQVVFRETWRVVAAAANRMLYNDVSIQAVFSQEGGQQWLTDVQALVATFQPYTRRPEAHFKELLDSAKLLALDSDMVSELQQVLTADVDGLPARQQLKQLGINSGRQCEVMVTCWAFLRMTTSSVWGMSRVSRGTKRPSGPCSSPLSFPLPALPATSWLPPVAAVGCCLCPRGQGRHPRTRAKVWDSEMECTGLWRRRKPALAEAHRLMALQADTGLGLGAGGQQARQAEAVQCLGLERRRKPGRQGPTD
eukprot:jgi/Astpho2/268/Aster-02159